MAKPILDGRLRVLRQRYYDSRLVVPVLQDLGLSSSDDVSSLGLKEGSIVDVVVAKACASSKTLRLCLLREGSSAKEALLSGSAVSKGKTKAEEGGASMDVDGVEVFRGIMGKVGSVCRGTIVAHLKDGLIVEIPGGRRAKASRILLWSF